MKGNKMNIALHDVDSKIPNLALMKLSAWHKAQGDSVTWYEPFDNDQYDKVYSSKVFTYTPEDPYLSHPKIIKGGSGYDIKISLPDEIEHTCPDYSLYETDHSMGFLTRGCPNKCSWCIVPEKEGNIRANADIDEFVRHDRVILLDNNILAHEHGLQQIEKIAKKGIRVDFNQGLDARLIDNSMAKLLSRLKWIRFIRLACDSTAMIAPVRKAVELLRWNNAKSAQYMVYVLIKDVDDALERIRFLKGMYLDPFAQPYRDREGTEPTKRQKSLARWCNMKATYKSCTWEDYNG